LIEKELSVSGNKENLKINFLQSVVHNKDKTRESVRIQWTNVRSRLKISENTVKKGDENGAFQSDCHI
jgi:hypothetical protein